MQGWPDYLAARVHQKIAKDPRQDLDLAKERMKKLLTKSALADRMHTSRTAVDRLLDPDNLSGTLQTLGRAAQAFGKRLHIEMV